MGPKSRACMDLRTTINSDESYGLLNFYYFLAFRIGQELGEVRNGGGMQRMAFANQACDPGPFMV